MRSPVDDSSTIDSRGELSATVNRGSSIGRYVILGMVGRGAMGDVYSAFDPDLDRKVAIKLLRVKRGSSVGSVDGRTRLLREAQAIAKLSHPNVIVVHDVGTFEDRVFIAMEFVEGGTLGFWLQAQPRHWRDVLSVFISAGRGLQHAHESHLVHRDFKPDNVMVRVDGEVRVMDFGLVRYVDAHETLSDVAPHAAPPTSVVNGAEASLGSTIYLSPPQPASSDPLPESFSHQIRLTQTGTLLGTPAYMAPEQFTGQTVDARTDQFSFSVALYEALFGMRPFDGGSLAELTANVVGGLVRQPPQRTQVPLRIWRALRRGLSVSPADRFASMNDLLAELTPHIRPPRAKQAALVGAAAMGLLLMAGLAVQGRSVSGQSLCALPTQRFDGVWESPGGSGSRRAAIERRFRTGGKSSGTTISTGRSSSWGWVDDRSRLNFAAVALALDRYVADWSTVYKDACEATNYRRDQSAEVLDLRMSCLNDRVNELRRLSDSLVSTSIDVTADPAQALTALTPPDRCSEVRRGRDTSAVTDTTR